jgi:hypothetical protein
MNVQITLNGTDITEHVTDYDIDRTLCTGIGMARVTLATPVSANLFNTFVIYEEGIKKGTFYLHTLDDEGKVLNGQDGSILLQEYFIAENYFIDYPSNSGYWIKKFLDEAKVSYVFHNGEDGSLLNNNTSLGIANAMDTLVPLLQQNGWFIYFDADNVAHIGKMEVDTTSYKEVLNDTHIVDINGTAHDKMFRNRAVVWGNANPKTGRSVFTDLDKSGWYENEYPGGHDQRTVVIANSGIANKAESDAIAYRVLREFEKPSYEITLKLKGAWNLKLGDYIFVNSQFLTKSGVVTTIGSSLSTDGLYTHVILNQRCPRLFAIFDYGGFVYVGTRGAGVWRKPVKFNQNWSNFSEGLTDLDIKDLAVDCGIHACVSEGGKLFIRTEIDATWQNFVPTLAEVPSGGGYVVYPTADTECTTCAIDKTNGDIIAGFSLRDDDEICRSWIYHINSQGSYGHLLVDTDDNRNYKLYSLDNNGESNTVTALLVGSGVSLAWNKVGRSACPDNVYFNNTTEYIEQGYEVNVKNNNTEGIAYNLSTNIISDGEYIYEVRGGVRRNAQVTNVLESSLTILSYEKSSGAFAGLEQIQFRATEFGVSVPTLNPYHCWAIGDRKVAVYVDSFNGFQGDGTAKGIWVIDFATHAIQKYTTVPSESVFPDFFAYVERDNQKLLYMYTFDIGDSSTTVKIHTFDFDTHSLSAVTNVNIGAYSGAPFFSAYDYATILVTENYLVLPIVGWYWNSEVYAEYYIPTVIYYNLDTGQPNVYQVPHSTEVNIDVNYINTAGVIGDDLYMGLDLPDSDVIKKITPNGSVTTTYSNSSGWLVRHGYIAGKENLYFVFRDGNTQSVINVVTGDVEFTAPGDEREASFSKNVDNDGSVLYYSKVAGTIKKYSITGNTLATYNVGGFPETHNGYEVDYERTSNLAIVYDTIVLVARADVNFYYMGGWNVELQRTVLVTPDNQMVIVGGGSPIKSRKKKVLQGKKGGPYEGVFTTARLYQVEIDQASPVILYGGVEYSGIVISGVQTGYNMGDLYVSPYGDYGTFSLVNLTNTMNSYVSDARSCTMCSGVGEEAGFSTFLFISQPSDQVINENTTSDLYMIDVAGMPLEGAGAILTSGELGSINSLHYGNFDGYINHLETSNLGDVPYMFVSISGVPPVFYQKDTRQVSEAETTFIDSTRNLPYAEILCIRCDDVM